MEIEIHPLFIDTVFEIKMKEEINCQEILDYKNYIQEKDPIGIKRSNNNSWQKDIEPGECFEIDKMISIVEMNINDLFQNIYGINTNIRNSNKWFNANPRGGSNEYHTHPGCIFSGVFYISASEDPAQGEILFSRESHHMYEEMKTRSSIVNLDQQPTYVESLEIKTQSAITARQGSAIVFPNFYNHKVSENLTDIERVVIGMNFSVA